MTALVLLADALDAGGRPTALLSCGARPLLRRFLAEAATLGLDARAVLTHRDALDEVTEVAGGEVTVVPYSGPAGVLASLGAQLDLIAGPVVLAHAEVMTNTDALADVVADARLGTAALVGADEPGRLRLTQGRVVAAGSAEHALSGGSHVGLGVLRVAAEDRAALATAARELAGFAMVHGWDADPLDLLLMAAVRRGLVVTAVPVGGYVWARPGTAEQCERASRRIDGLDEHRVRLERVARPDDGFYSTFVVRRLSRLVTGLAVRAGWAPNPVTLVALGVALVAAAFFATGERAGLVAGAVLLQVSLVIDCVDGELARYTRRFTALGAWLDATTDRVKEYAVYAALAVGAARAGESAWTLAAATLALQVFRNFVDFGFVVTVAERRAALRGERLPLDLTRDAAAAPRGLAAADAAAPVPAQGPAQGAASPGQGAVSLGQGAVSLSERTSRAPALKWAKRMVFLPIGERWLIISVLAAASGARAVFIALLALGLVSAVYATAGRVLRALADPPAAVSSAALPRAAAEPT